MWCPFRLDPGHIRSFLWCPFRSDPGHVRSFLWCPLRLDPGHVRSFLWCPFRLDTGHVRSFLIENEKMQRQSDHQDYHLRQLYCVIHGAIKSIKRAIETNFIYITQYI